MRVVGRAASLRTMTHVQPKAHGAMVCQLWRCCAQTCCDCASVPALALAVAESASTCTTTVIVINARINISTSVTITPPIIITITNIITTLPSGLSASLLRWRLQAGSPSALSTRLYIGHTDDTGECGVQWIQRWSRGAVDHLFVL